MYQSRLRVKRIDLKVCSIRKTFAFIGGTLGYEAMCDANERYVWEGKRREEMAGASDDEVESGPCVDKKRGREDFEVGRDLTDRGGDPRRSSSSGAAVSSSAGASGNVKLKLLISGGGSKSGGKQAGPVGAAADGQSSKDAKRNPSAAMSVLAAAPVQPQPKASPTAAAAVIAAVASKPPVRAGASRQQLNPYSTAISKRSAVRPVKTLSGSSTTSGALAPAPTPRLALRGSAEGSPAALQLASAPAQQLASPAAVMVQDSRPMPTWTATVAPAAASAASIPSAGARGITGAMATPYHQQQASSASAHSVLSAPSTVVFRGPDDAVPRRVAGGL